MFGKRGLTPWKLYSIILIVGLTLTGVIGYSVWRVSKMVNEFSGQIYACDELLDHISAAKLALAEYAHHHETADVHALNEHLNESDHAVEHLISGEVDDSCAIESLAQADLRAIADHIHEEIERFRGRVFELISDQSDGLRALCLDSGYSAMFGMIEGKVRELGAGIRRHQTAELQQFQIAHVALAVTCLLLTLLVLAGLRQYERQQAAAYGELKRSNEQLSDDLATRSELEDRLELTQFAMDHLAEGVIWADANRQIVYVNRAICHLLGYTADELRAMKIEQIDPNMPAERFGVVWQTLRETGSIVVPTSLLTKNGSRKPVEVFADILDHDGVEYAVSTVRDMTDIEFAHQNLEESQRQYREVVDNVDVGIGLVDSNERFVFANRKAEDIYGVPRGTLPGRSLAEFLHPAQFLTCQKETKNRAQGINNEYDIEIMRPNGEQRLIHLIAKPRFLEDGAFVGTFGVFEDITDKRRITEEREQLEDRLRRAEKMESLGLLAGGVAHDLNNMLGPLVGYPEMIIRKLPPDSPVIKWVHKIEKAAEMAADVIGDLLTLARRGRYQMKPTSINEVLKEYVDSSAFGRAIERNPGITFTINLDPRIGLIDGSATHLSKVFMNIIQNALEATGSGGSVSVSTSQHELDHLSTGFETVEKGEYIAVRVVDTGSGIPAEEISKIFEPYFSKKKMGASGSGLGLAVVYGVVKDHKGYYDVISEVGRGTEFILYFPVTTKTQDAAAPEKKVVNLKELRVLVVGDNPETRELNVAMLQSAGITAESASSEQAMQTIRDSSFDCSVVDVPKHQGCIVAPWLRAAREAGRDLPFVCLVDALDSTGEEIPPCPEGLVQIVRKPCKPSAMVEAIQSMVIANRAAVSQICADHSVPNPAIPV